MSNIFRIEKSKDYTVMSNFHLRDKALSLKSKGLLSLMLSLPEEWDYTIAGLATICAVGKDAIRSALNELEDGGYMRRFQTHDDTGQFSGNDYVIYETPQPLSENPTTDETDPPLSGFPLSDKPLSGKPSSENPTEINIDISSKDKYTPIVPKKDKAKSVAPKFVLDMFSEYAGDDKELFVALWKFAEMRKNKQSTLTTERMVTLLLNSLDKLSGGKRDIKMAMLDEATLKSWKTVYAPKGDYPAGDATPHESEDDTWE